MTFHDRSVYVLNARDGGTIQGYARLGGLLVPIPLWHRRLGLDPTQTPEFTHTPGQVGFTPDGNRLLVTTKANGNAVQAFDVDGLGGVSARPVTSVLDNAVPFAFAFDVRGHLALTEAGPNAVATFALNRSGALGGTARTGTHRTGRDLLDRR